MEECCFLALPAPYGLLILLSRTTQDHQSRGGTTHKGLDTSASITIKKMSCWLTYSTVLRRHLFSGDSLFSHNYSLCHIHKQTNKQIITRTPAESVNSRFMGLCLKTGMCNCTHMYTHMRAHTDIHTFTPTHICTTHTEQE